VVIDHIAHHGYTSVPGSQLVLLVHPSDLAQIVAIRAGTLGATYDFIPSSGAPAFLTQDAIVGDRAPSEFNGLKVAGSYGKGRPEALAQWAMRYAVERGDGRTSGALRFCAHPGEAQVRYIFAYEPNHSYCASCRYATGTWAMSRMDGRLPQRAPSATPLRDGVRPSGTARPVRPFVQATRFVRRPSGPGPAGSSSTDRADYRSSNMS
jgi:hypothetical protein